MRKKLIGLAFLSLLTFGTYSCSNEIDVNEVPSQTDNKSARIVSEEIIPEVKEYYDNVKAIILYFIAMPSTKAKNFKSSKYMIK